MAIRVTPDARENTHLFSLTGLDSNGYEITVGLNPVDKVGGKSIHAVRYSGYPTGSLRSESGAGEFSSKRPPYGEFERRDWSGGIGSLNGLTDAKKYWMGKRVWSTVPERMMLAPQVFRSTINFPVRTGNESSLNVPITWQSVAAGTRVAWSVTTAYTGNGVDLLLRTLADNVFTLRIFADNAGEPGTLIDTVTESNTLLGSNRYQFEKAIASGTFWIEISGAAAFELATSAQIDYTVKTSADGVTWSASAWDAPVFFVMSATGADDWIPFTYRWATYVVTGQRLYINGDRGACDDNSGNLSTLVDATKSWTTNEWAGAIVKINGTAHTWRKIVSNTATTLTVDRAWDAAHTTGNFYVILGAEKWTEITGHGFTANVTDVEVVREETVYFAMGSDQQMRRMKESNEAGVWTRTFAEDTQDTQGGTVLPGANFLCPTFDQVDGPVLYKAVNGDLGYITKAPAVAWGTNLTWGTEIKVGGDNWEDLSGICEYDGKIAVTAMDSVWMVKNGVAEKVSIDMQSQWTGFTGRRPAVMPPYLVFPFGNRPQRLYQTIVESFGPERDSALPKRYDGQVMDNLSIVGGLAIAKDGGKLGYYAEDAEGGAFLYRDGNWHPLAFTGLGSGMRAVFYQMRYDQMDMVWFGDHNGLWYMYWPRSWDYTKDPMYSQTNKIERDGWFITGWYDTGRLLPSKWWDYLITFTDNLSSTYGRKIRLYYQVSDGTEYEIENLASNWTFAEEVTDGFNNTITINKQGRRIRFLFLLMGDGDGTPILHGYNCNYISKEDDAESWQMAISIQDIEYNRSGEVDDILTTKEKADIINYWARTVRPLTMNCAWPLWDDREVQILRPGLVPLESTPEGQENMYASLTIVGMEEPAEDPPEENAACPLNAPANGPYDLGISGTLDLTNTSITAAEISYTVRTGLHENITAYTLTGTFYEWVDGTYVESSRDDTYAVYALDLRGNVVAVGVHDAVDPENLGVRTGTFTVNSPTRIAAIRVALLDDTSMAVSLYSYELPGLQKVVEYKFIESTGEFQNLLKPFIAPPGGPSDYAALIHDHSGGGEGYFVYDLAAEYYIHQFEVYWQWGGWQGVYGSTDYINWYDMKEMWPAEGNTVWRLEKSEEDISVGAWKNPINARVRYLKFQNKIFVMLGGGLKVGYFKIIGDANGGKVALTGMTLENVCP